MLAAFSECTSPRVKRKEEWRKEGDSDRVVAGNFTEWRNNVSYATFPEWRTVGGRESLELANTHRAREEERECNRDGENGREKERKRCSHSLACN